MNASFVEKVRSISALVNKSHGKEFLAKLVARLAQASGMDYVFISELDKNKQVSKIQALHAHGAPGIPFSYDLTYTPCSNVTDGEMCLYASNVADLFPQDFLLADMDIQGYIGSPLYNSAGEVDGLLVAMNESPIDTEDEVRSLFEIACNIVAIEMERSRQAKQISYLSDYDTLTGLASKAMLERRLQAVGEHSLLVVAMNHVSALNQAFGYRATDRILKKTADYLSEVFPCICHASLGPSKFALLYAGRMDLQEMAHEIRQFFLATPIRTDDISVYITFSCGGAIGEDDLLRRSASALQQARSLGVAAVVVEPDETPVASVERAEQLIESNRLLHFALERDLVIPFFQGIANSATGAIDKYEVLARIRLDGNVVSPGAFLPAAEASGLISRVTRVIIDKAFRVMANHTQSFSINISEDDLNENYLLDFLLEKTREYNFPPERVTLEILESVSTLGTQANGQQLKDLKANGFQLSIDDFGSEYASFSRVLELDVDFLKIDRSFVLGLPEDVGSRNIIEAIVGFCQKSGIRTVAENVDTQERYDLIKSLGVDYIQGFLLSKPQALDTGEFSATFESRVELGSEPILVVTGRGHVDRPDAVINAIAEARPQIPEGQHWHLLVDAAELDYFQLSEADVAAAMQADLSSPYLVGVQHVAVVAQVPQTQEAFLMRQTASAETEFEIKVFDRLANARAWLLEGHVRGEISPAVMGGANSKAPALGVSPPLSH